MSPLVRMLLFLQLLVLLPWLSIAERVVARPAIGQYDHQVLSADAFIAAAKEVTSNDPLSPIASALLAEAARSSSAAALRPTASVIVGANTPATTTPILNSTPAPAAIAGSSPAVMSSSPIPLGAAVPAAAEIPLGAANQTDMIPERDPANGPFPGGVPMPLPDVPVTAVFLVLFILGAFTHITIYRTNSKRGHKFLLSDLMFDFCMIRTLTCTFRIIWSFISPRGVILVALIFENGGAAVIFAVNLFFAQRIFRSMHPKIGWSPPFTVFTLFLIWSVPSVIVLNIISLSVSFFSVGNEAQLAATEQALTFGSSWNVMLSIMPLVMLLVAGLIPMTKKPEPFGSGRLPGKAALLAYASSTLGVGAAIRAAALLNPAMMGDMTSILFGKAVFYTTGFMLEIFVVAIYAVARIDLLFHIPNGSSRPGDYAAGQKTERQRDLAAMQSDIEEQLDQLGIGYETISPTVSVDERSEFIIAKLTINKGVGAMSGALAAAKYLSSSESDTDDIFETPPRPKRGRGRSPFETSSTAQSRRESRTWGVNDDLPNVPDAVYATNSPPRKGEYQQQVDQSPDTTPRKSYYQDGSPRKSRR